MPVRRPLGTYPRYLDPNYREELEGLIARNIRFPVNLANAVREILHKHGIPITVSTSDSSVLHVLKNDDTPSKYRASTLKAIKEILDSPIPGDRSETEKTDSSNPKQACKLS